MKTTRKTFLRNGAVACLGFPALSSAGAVGGASTASTVEPRDTSATDGARVRYDFSWNRRDHERLAGRRVTRPQSIYFDRPGLRPTPVNLEGKVSFYPQERIQAVRQRLKGVDPKAYLQDILDHILKDVRTDRERVAAICGFVGDAIYYNPTHNSFCLADDGKNWRAVLDPLELLELHDGRCGQGVRVTLALLKLAGIEARQVPVSHHVSCEARYDGGWHLADALMFGVIQPHRDGVVPSADEMKREPYFMDAFVMPYLYCAPETYLSEDGFRALGFVFGEWGARMPYQSFYWGAPFDSPPTLPYPLVTQELDGQRVRLNWAPSFKPKGAAVEYKVSIFADRDCKQLLHSATTGVNSLEWAVPEMNRVYFTETVAMDDHRRHNPKTWYLSTRNNFMLTAKDDYGWFGVV